MSEPGETALHTDAEEHAIYQIANAPLRLYPFPHIYVESVFPAAFYSALRANWPQSSQLVSLETTGRVSKGAFRERFIMPLREPELSALPGDTREFWTGMAQWMLGSTRLRSAVLDKFGPQVHGRFGEAYDEVDFTHEALVVRDHTQYKLGAHTDSPYRVVSLLFYCPDDESLSHLGTSLYKPIDPAFSCVGGPHYRHSLFHKVATMEYKPNALFAFVKTNTSFHGVEPIRDADVLRDLILYDIQLEALPDQPEETGADAPQSIAAGASQATLSTKGPGGGGSLGLRILKNILRRGR
jgi:hypothetical protein